jgi:tRNA 5-methylaminomethyl-2-thiouridine biosynthesis bifunctional protein
MSFLTRRIKPLLLLASGYNYLKMKINNAKLSWFKNNLSSATFNDIYHSSSGALEESLHVFIQGNKLVERWSVSHESDRFSIAEIGF